MESFFRATLNPFNEETTAKSTAMYLSFAGYYLKLLSIFTDEQY